jgi:hypothetical protein
MRRIITYFMATTLMAVMAFVASPAQAQSSAAVGFRNELKTPVLVQGFTIVNGTQRRGPAILVAPGRTAWDNNVPAGDRYYTVYDGNTPRVVLLRDARVSVTPRSELFFLIRPNGPSRITLTADSCCQ